MPSLVEIFVEEWLPWLVDDMFYSDCGWSSSFFCDFAFDTPKKHEPETAQY